MNDDCQFAMEELMKEITGPTVDKRTIKSKVKKYGESTNRPKHPHATIRSMND